MVDCRVILVARVGFVIFYNRLLSANSEREGFVRFIWQGGMAFARGLPGGAAAFVAAQCGCLPWMTQSARSGAGAPRGYSGPDPRIFINAELWGSPDLRPGG